MGSDWKRNNKPSERGVGKGKVSCKVKPYIITTSVSSLEDDKEHKFINTRLGKTAVISLVIIIF